MIDLANTTFDHCIKCTVCTVYCPVARASARYPGPKWSGPDTERLRIKSPELVDETLSLCTNCKRCEIACPSGVRIADIIQGARHAWVRDRKRPRDFLMSHTDLVGGLATRMAPLANTAHKVPGARFLAEKLAGVPRERVLPAYGRGTFRGWFKKHEAARQREFERRVVYFTGCYVNYNDHQLGKDVVAVMNALGYGVEIVEEKCCGVPLIANGYLADATKNARHNIRALGRAVEEQDLRCISSSSSCTFALLHEYAHLLDLDNQVLTRRLDYVTRFVAREFARGNVPEMRPLGLRVGYHTPCHLERMGGVLHTWQVLRRIPGLEVVPLGADCCGMSGTYGFKKEYYAIAQEVGRPLFERVAEVAPDYVACDCESCKWQIEMSTKVETPHPISLLARALAD